MKTTTSDKIPGFPPGPIDEDTAREHFERGARPAIERNRWFLISCFLGLALLANGIGLSMLFPLKTVDTQVIRRLEGGRLMADGVAVGNWTPDKDEIGYFLNQWANNVYDINAATIKGTIESSASLVVGNAVAQLRELRTKDNPYVLLKRNPNYIRTYEFISINFIEDNVGFLRFKTIARDNGDPVVTVYAMRVTFNRVKPTSVAEVMKNPAGLYITSFNVTEEVPSKSNTPADGRS